MPGLLLLLAIVVPLVAFAGTAAWGEPLAAGGALVAAAFAGGWAWRRRPDAPLRIPLAGALLLAAFVAAAQTVPLPAGIAVWLAPASHRVWTSAPFGDGWHPLSLAPHASSGRATLFLGAALLHVAAAWWIGVKRRQTLALTALAGVAVAVCAFAVSERLGGPALWLHGFAQPEQAFGPFPNRNDLGVLAAAAAPLAAAGLLGRLGRLARRARSSAEGWGAALRSGPDTPIGAGWAGSLALLAVTVFASGSHSAIFALVAGLGLFAGAAWFRRGAPRWTLPVALAVAGAAAVSSGAIRPGSRSHSSTGEVAAPRFFATQVEGDFAVRRPLWRRVVAVATDSPVTGCGAGAIAAALPLHPDPGSPGFAARAENDLLETAAELGVPATGAILLLAGLWLRRALRTARDPGDAGLAAAASVGAIAALATGSMGTFVVSVPALLLFGAAVAALGVPWAPDGIEEARAVAVPGRRQRLALVLAAGVLVLPLVGTRGAAAWIARPGPSPDRATLLRAARFDAASPALSLALARSHETDARHSPEPWIDAADALDAAEQRYRRRLRSLPTDAFARLSLAALLETRARDPSLPAGRAAELRLRAEALTAAAVQMDAGDPAVARYRKR